MYKSINDLTDQKISDLNNFHGAFWAFSQSQINEAKKPDTKYTVMLGNLFCPSETAQTFFDEMTKIYDDGEKEFLKINSTEEIIKYDLSNHEAYYLGDPSETIENLKAYNISADEIIKVFKKEYQRHIELDLI